MRFQVKVRELRYQGKVYAEGQQFDADESSRDIKVLRAIKRIEEVAESAPAPKVTESESTAAADPPVTTTNVTDEETPTKRRYTRRDLRAEE